MYKIDKQKVGERLIEILDKLNIKSSRQFAKALEINGKEGDPSYMAKAEKGGGLSETYITAISKQFNVNPEWLKFGKGEMFGVSPHKVPHETGKKIETAIQEIAEPDITYSKAGYQEKYIASLERENARLRKDLNSSLIEIQRSILLIQAMSETTQELLIELLAGKNKKRTEELAGIVGKHNGEKLVRILKDHKISLMDM